MPIAAGIGLALRGHRAHRRGRHGYGQVLVTGDELVETDRCQKIKQLYHSALERKGRERRAYLQEACQGDEALLREVESLMDRGTGR
jgi:hypothetical protein